MQKILLIVIVVIMNNICLYSQILPELTELEFLKGKVKKIEARYCPNNKHIFKEVSEYDSLGRIVSKISYYIKKNPHKDFFSYDSIGNLSLHIYQDNDGLQKYSFEYKYDTEGRIVMQLEMKDDGRFFRKYDSVVYNSDNLPIRYLLYHSINKYDIISIHYSTRENGEYIRYIEEQRSDAIIGTTEAIRLYNVHGFLTKKIHKTSSVESKHFESIIDEMKDFVSGPIQNWKHIEEYDYVDYKYDKQGNWTEHNCYLNWDNKGRNIHVKSKRKIEYY